MKKKVIPMKKLILALTASFLAIPLYASDAQVTPVSKSTPCERAEQSVIERMQEQFGVKAVCECTEKDGVPVLQCKADKGFSA